MVSVIKKMVDPKGLVDRRIFVDPDIYKQELEQIFGRCWLFVGHESHVPKPNDFFGSYMGEDPILLTRDGKGKLHAFLNMCRHRGNRICRADAGNAPSFMCTYHGWTFATDGKLVGVPGYKEAYFEELDRSQWGLVEAKVDSYKGMVFATWDAQAPSLDTYLGNMKWYLDLHLDRREGGSEMLPGIMKWTLEANWKFPADNFGGDGYHVPITHGSVGPSGIAPRGGAGGRDIPYAQDRTPGHQVYAGNGHGIVGFGGGAAGGAGVNSMPPVVRDYYIDHLPELEQRLGLTRAKQVVGTVSTIFPNSSPHMRAQFRVYPPKGPHTTELWVFCIVDKHSPPEFRTAMKRHLTNTFGPSGGLEQDDMNNWINCTASGYGSVGNKYMSHVAMGIGHEGVHEALPGKVAPSPSEMNQRAFYGKWAEMMEASSWSQISNK